MYRKRWVCLGLSAFFGVVCIVVGVVGPILLDQMIQKSVNQQMLMTESEADTWGLVPGKTEVVLYRQHFFFNVTNPEEIKWNGAKPALAETKAYRYSETVHYFDRIYEPIDGVDNAYVKFRRYVWMNKTDDWVGVKDTDLITQVNVGAISAWSQMKHLPPETIALAALYSIVSGLDGSLYVSALAQGIAASFLPLIDNVYNTEVFKLAGIPADKGTKIWTDSNFGWANQTTFVAWIQAELQCETSTGFNYTATQGTGGIFVLKTYFGLTDAQMKGLLGGWLLNVFQATSIIISTAYCDPVACSPHYLTALQWAKQGVSNNPPLPSIPPVPSVAMINSTISGYPEISYFQENNYPAGSPLADVRFSVDDALKLLDYNLTTGWPSGSDYTLLDVGHINALFAFGRLGDFASISDLLNLTGPSQAEVIFDYLNELVSVTALQGNTNQSVYNQGNRGLTGELSIGNLLSQVMSQLYYGASDALAVELTARYVYAVLKTTAINCTALLVTCGVSGNTASTLCNSNPALMWSSSSNLDLWVLVYWNGINSNYGIEFATYSGLSLDEMTSLFAANSGLVAILAPADSYLQSYYNCQSPGFRCFPNELFVMQWGMSGISNNLPTILQVLGMSNQTSLLSWGSPFTDLFPAPPEYSNYSGSSLPLATAQSLLTPMQILNQVRCQHYFVLIFNNDVLDIPSYDNITEEFGVEDVAMFTRYLRFMVDQFAIQDLFITQTVNEWLWTSSSPLLVTLANTNPLQGGNPAIDPTQVQLGQNTTRASLRFPDHYKHGMYTGQTEMESKLRWWYLFFGSPNVTLYSKVYSGHTPDGPLMTYQNLQVWAKPEAIMGGDALNFQTNVDSSSAVWLYLDQFLRFGQGGYTESLTRSNMNLYRFTISSGLLDNYIDNPDNANYYCYGPSGAVNITPVMQGPIFISKPYFYGGEAEVLLGVLNFTTPYDPDLSTYDSYFDVEHFTGAVFEDEEKIMTMVELRTDPLYPNLGQMGYDEYGIWTYMPIFYLNRSSYYTDERVNVT